MSRPPTTGRLGRARRRRRASWFASANSHGRALRFEPLEERRLLAIIVDTLLDENNGLGEGGISLREAIASAAPNDTIEFDVDFAVEGTIVLIHGELDIDKSLSIVGPGANLLTIDAQGASRVFNVNNNNASLINVSFYGLTITGGVTGVDGGGIFNSETLTVAACNITDNSAEDGGGIYNFAGTFTVIDSTISNNTASGALGGAGIFSHSENKTKISTITNSTISNNVSSSSGGGIYNFEGTLIVAHSTITENDALGNQGGGIASLGDTNRVVTQVHSSIIAGNLYGDVDVVVGSAATFQSLDYNLIGSGNSTASFSNDDDEVIGTADPQLGPLADNGGPTPTRLPLVDSDAIDTGNPSFAPPPGADQRGAGFARVFDGNGDSVARIDKGAVERDVISFVVSTLDDVNNFDYSDGDFSLREAIAQASLVPAGTPTITFAPSLFTAENPSTIVLALDALEIGKRMVIVGPGANLLTIDANENSRVFTIDNFDDGNVVEVELRGLTITGGRDTGSGGGIYTNERLTVADSVITGNTAQWGGGVYNAAFGTLRVIRSRIAGNAANVFNDGTSEGGGFYNWGGKATFIETTITGNTAATGAGVSNANFGDTVIVSSTLSDNTAGFFGGGAHTDSGTLTIRDSTLSGNHAELGGAVHVFTAIHYTTTINNSTISGNVAPSGGGGVYVQEGRVLIEFCTITENVADDTKGSGVRSADTPVAHIEFYSSLIAANFDPDGGGQDAPYDVAVDSFNTFESHGFNIVGTGDFVDDTFGAEGDQIIGDDDPRLGPLADNGGPTLTHALLFGSPALDKGDPEPAAEAGEPTYDQRGKSYGRIRNGSPPAASVMDVGAFEAQGVLPALPGDYNIDDNVDVADYVVWRNTINTTVVPYSGADGTGDGRIDQDDYSLWRSQFGKELPTASGAVAVVAASGFASGAADTEHKLESELPKPQNVATDRIADLSPPEIIDPLRRAARTVRSTSVSAARHDAALLAWFTSQSDSHRGPREDVSRDDPADRRDSTDTAVDDATIDAALVALCTRL